MGFENIWEGEGVGIAITGMTIVFVALSLIATFISLLPKVLEPLSAILPSEDHSHTSHKTQSLDDEEIAVAIGVALHHRKMQKT